MCIDFRYRLFQRREMRRGKARNFDAARFAVLLPLLTPERDVEVVLVEQICIAAYDMLLRRGCWRMVAGMIVLASEIHLRRRPAGGDEASADRRPHPTGHQLPATCEEPARAPIYSGG